MPRTAMNDIPEASPSSPSIRLNALIAPVTQNTVITKSTQAGRDGQRVLNPSPAHAQTSTAATS